MFDLFKKKEKEKENSNEVSLIAIASLLIHSAKIDENFTDKERNIIKDSLIEMGAKNEDIIDIMKEAENLEKDSNQILDFTKQVKNINQEEKEIIIEALWGIIYSDEKADIYETNLMRRLSGLLYLDKKIVGEIKERIRLKEKK